MRRTVVLSVLLASMVTGCAPAGPSAPHSSSPAPSASGIGVTPSGPPIPSSAPATGQPVTFAASDGTMLTGRVFGSGQTTVILSNMGDNDSTGWEAFAPRLAAAGVRVLAYAYRYPPGGFRPPHATAVVHDLRGAAAYARSDGTQRIILMGASLGGILTAKLAGTLGAAAVVVLSSPRDLAEYGLVVSDAELAAIAGPKLFVAAADDPIVPAAETEAVFRAVAEPRAWKLYPEGGHGVLILRSAHGEDLSRRLVSFVEA